jgi:hypothetical protein
MVLVLIMSAFVVVSTLAFPLQKRPFSHLPSGPRGFLAAPLMPQIMKKTPLSGHSSSRQAMPAKVFQFTVCRVKG